MIFHLSKTSPKMNSLKYLGNSYYSTQNLVVVVNAGKASVNVVKLS